MKISVILGVFQMSIGIIVKGSNSLYFKRYIEFFFEFIPQLVLLLFFFGWMDALIIGKWFQPKYIEENWLPDDFKGTQPLYTEYGPQQFLDINLSPAIITTMIDIFLGGASNKAKIVDPANPNALRYQYVFGDI